MDYSRGGYSRYDQSQVGPYAYGGQHYAPAQGFGQVFYGW